MKRGHEPLKKQFQRTTQIRILTEKNATQSQFSKK